MTTTNPNTKLVKKNGKAIHSNNPLARRYELAYHKILNDYPAWKKDNVKEAIKNTDINDRFYSEFIDSVIELAEGDGEILITEQPAQD